MLFYPIVVLFSENRFWIPHTNIALHRSHWGVFLRQTMTLALSRLWSAAPQGFCDEWVCPSAKLKKSWNLAFGWVSRVLDGMGKWAEGTIHSKQPDPPYMWRVKSIETRKHIGPTLNQYIEYIILSTWVDIPFVPFHSVFESHSSVDGWRGSPLQHPLCNYSNYRRLEDVQFFPFFPPSPVRHDLEDLRRGAWSQPEPPRQDRFSTGHVSRSGTFWHDFLLSIIVSPCFPYCLVLK